MTNQITDTLFMVRPGSFRKNEQTEENNYFQSDLQGLTQAKIQDRALGEFDEFVEKLRAIGVKVLVFQDSPENNTPDSIFPNNWISLHQDGTVITYPMFAKNRRAERRDEILDLFRKSFRVKEVKTLAEWENQGMFLEGTGSMIFDRPGKVAYASLSERTSAELLERFSEMTGFSVVDFHSYQTVNGQRLPIYHTNVMMALGEDFCVICLDSIDDPDERAMVQNKLLETGKEIIAISENQMHQFAGNMLQVSTNTGEKYTVMSDAAYASLDTEQLTALQKHGGVLHSPISTIETLGGGSVRCMMAEVFLPGE